MERPLIKKSHFDKVKKIYEYEDVHYFYWSLEIGLGVSKIFDIEIPVFPFKRYDYEPIKVMRNYNNDVVILTRFHYDLLIYFNKPLLINQKPLVEFLIGSHSPLVFTGKDEQITWALTLRSRKAWMHAK